MIRVGLGRLQLAISPLSGIDKAWFNIDVILKQVTMNCRRVKVRNSDMTYERERLASATNARSVYGRSTTVDEKAKAENEIRGPPRSESNRFPPYRWRNRSDYRVRPLLTVAQSDRADVELVFAHRAA